VNVLRALFHPASVFRCSVAFIRGVHRCFIEVTRPVAIDSICPRSEYGTLPQCGHCCPGSLLALVGMEKHGEAYFCASLRLHWGCGRAELR
jgi:hypothetical protein